MKILIPVFCINQKKQLNFSLKKLSPVKDNLKLPQKCW